MKAAVGPMGRAGEIDPAALFSTLEESRFPTGADLVINGVRRSPIIPQARSLTAHEVISISAALADPTRFRILELICGRDTVTSQALCDSLGISPATMSHHLRLLRLADLVESLREGRWRHHRVRRETLNGYIVVLSRLGT